MRILVTGAGLVGCYTALELIEQGHNVTMVDIHSDKEYMKTVLKDKYIEPIKANICDYDLMYKILKENLIDVVVHTAGLVGQKAENNPFLAYKVNAEGTASIVEASRLAVVKKFIFISSLSIYDWSKVGSNNAVPEHTPAGPNSVYGSTKVAAEAIVRAYALRGWLETIILRPAGIYGYGKFRGGSKLGFIVQQVLLRSIKGNYAVFNAGLGTNEYLYVKDISHAISLVIKNNQVKNEVFNIGTGYVNTPNELAEIIKKLIPGAKIGTTEPKRESLPLDISKASEVLGYEPSYNLMNGLNEMRETLTNQPLELVKEK